MLGLNAIGAPGVISDFCPEDWSDLFCDEFHAIKCDYSSPSRNPNAPQLTPDAMKPTAGEI
jgi:hypothetical protein